MKTPLQDILSQLRERLAAIYGSRLAKLVLYGSQARGDARPDSDIDVMVVLDGEVKGGDERLRVSEPVADICLRADAVIVCFFVSKQRYEQEKSPLLLNARAEGLAF